jgi:hypothetical protein
VGVQTSFNVSYLCLFFYLFYLNNKFEDFFFIQKKKNGHSHTQSVLHHITFSCFCASVQVDHLSRKVGYGRQREGNVSGFCGHWFGFDDVRAIQSEPLASYLIGLNLPNHSLAYSVKKRWPKVKVEIRVVLQSGKCGARMAGYDDLKKVIISCIFRAPPVGEKEPSFTIVNCSPIYDAQDSYAIRFPV